MAEPLKDEQVVSAPSELDVAIVGGGIAGLYCALKCDRSRFPRIGVFEATKAVGGRISTTPFPESGLREFDAEFGPMRIEPDQQPLLKELLDDLQITEKQSYFTEAGFKRGAVAQPEKATTDSQISQANAYLVPFPAYSSPADSREPRYDLSGEEREQKTPLDLLKLAFVRLLGRLVADAGQKTTPKQRRERDTLDRCLEEGRRALMLAVASHQREWKGSFQGWINRLREEDYQNIREYSAIEYDIGDRIPLWHMGFWNLMSDVLSHDAVMKLRDQGAFYHLLPENPNAVEWLVFWLRGLKSSDNLQGIEGGMGSITERAKRKIPKQEIFVEHRLISLSAHENDSRVKLRFETQNNITAEVLAKHVILALPKSPLQAIVAQSGNAFPRKIVTHIGRCWGFPMTKVFAIVKNRWWQEEHRANHFAGRVPTREIHYWSSRDPHSRRGMIMFYSDRPGSNFWTNYLVKPGEQSKPDWFKVERGLFARRESSEADGAREIACEDDDSAPELGVSQTRRLIRKVVEYLHDTGAEALHLTDVEYYGIRDWGREPYGAANHTWLPETRAWIALKGLAGFALEGASSRVPNIHVCGEAYSDYHGFIEGSLRSAAHVLHCIHGARVSRSSPARSSGVAVPGGMQTPTPWLCTVPNCVCRKDGQRERGWEERP